MKPNSITYLRPAGLRLGWAGLLAAALWACALCPSALALEIQSVRVLANGKVELRCDLLPRVLASELSRDKRKITVRLAHCRIGDKVRETPGKGPVQDVLLQQEGKDALVFVMLRERRGFSLASLPYSRAVHINVLQWDTLAPADNFYHSGLLAEESGVRKGACEYYDRAVTLGHGDAAARMGLMSLANGQLSEARGHFIRAADLQSTVDDIYAGLAEILHHRGDSEGSARFADMYRKAAGRDSLRWLLKESDIQDLFTEESSPALELDDTELINLAVLPDSGAQTNAGPDGTGTEGDSRNETGERKPLFPDAAGKLKQPRSAQFNSPIPDWLKNTVIAVVFLAILLTLALAFFYWKWRKKQRKRAASAFGAAAGTTRTAGTYNDFENEILDAIRGSRDSREKDGSGPAGIPAEHAAYAPPAMSGDSDSPATTGKAADDGFSFFDDDEELPRRDDSSGPYRMAETADMNTGGNVPLQEEDKDPTAAAGPTPEPEDIGLLARKILNGKGTVDMALNLLKRRKQENNEKTGALDPAEIPDSSPHRARLAQKLGVSTGELEIKKNISGLAERGAQETDRKLERLSGVIGQKRGGT